VTAPQAPPLTVILCGSRLERRENGRVLAVRAPGADRCGAEPVWRSRGDRTRADAAVAWQDLSAVGGARAGNRFPGRPAGDGRQLRRARVSTSRAVRLPRSAVSLGTARPACP
jgi:hypothetical protein